MLVRNVNSAARIAAGIALSQTTELISLDKAKLDSCEGWYVPRHSLLMIYTRGNSEKFFKHCIQHAGRVSSLGQSVTFERAMHELHNDFGGDTWAVGQPELIRRGWIRFTVQKGKVTIFIGDRRALSLLSMLLLPYASQSLVLNDWKQEYEVKEPSEAQVQSILDQLSGASKNG